MHSCVAINLWAEKGRRIAKGSSETWESWCHLLLRTYTWLGLWLIAIKRHTKVHSASALIVKVWWVSEHPLTLNSWYPCYTRLSLGLWMLVISATLDMRPDQWYLAFAVTCWKKLSRWIPVYGRHNIMTANGPKDWVTAIFINGHFGVRNDNSTPYTAPSKFPWKFLSEQDAFQFSAPTERSVKLSGWVPAYEPTHLIADNSMRGYHGNATAIRLAHRQGPKRVGFCEMVRLSTISVGHC